MELSTVFFAVAQFVGIIALAIIAILVVGIILLITIEHAIITITYAHMLITTVKEQPSARVPYFIHQYEPFWRFRTYMYMFLRPIQTMKLANCVVRHRDHLWTYDATKTWIPKVTYQWK